MFELAEAGHHARIGWEHRSFEPVELPVAADPLCDHGRRGGWVTAVLRDDEGVRLLGLEVGDRFSAVAR